MRVFLAIWFALALSAAGLFAAGELSGRRAPGFALPDTKQKFQDLADYRGRVVLLDLMQTACPHCQALTPVLEQVKARYGGRVVVLSVVLPPDNATTVAAYVAKFKVTAPMLFDCGQMTASYVKPNPMRPEVHFPHLFIIDGEGMIRNDFASEEASSLTAPRLVREIDPLLGK